MSVATGCGFKEIYRFPHTTYPYSSCICTFLQQHPYFFVNKKCFFFVLVYIYICWTINRLAVFFTDYRFVRNLIY